MLFEETTRVGTWLKSQYPSLTQRHIEEALGAGLVKGMKGNPLKKGDRFNAHEPLQMAGLDNQLQKLSRGNLQLQVTEVINEDEFVVIDKPAGMPSHPLSLFDDYTVTHWALARFPFIAKDFVSVQPSLAPHRLDTGTSGLLIVTKTQLAYQNFRQQFTQKRIQKKYQAWCWGVAQKKHFEIALALAHSANDSKKMVAPSQGENFHSPVLEAQSIVTVERQLSDRFLASITCYTGVTHQVRAHLALVGFPLIGDKLYDDFFSSRSEQPRYHQLRAIELKSDSFTFNLPPTPFNGIF